MVGLRLSATIALTLLLTAPVARGAEPRARPFLEGLAFPTNMAFASDGTLFYTEKETGRVRVVTPDGTLLDRPFISLAVMPEAERGLLGIALHPDFEEQPWVYLYFSDPADGRNRLVRVRADGAVSAGRPEVLLEGLSAVAGYHNGGDLVFGADGTLFVALGEAHEAARAQDPGDLGGKIVRLTEDGRVPDDGPYGPDSPVWSVGHRNSFGLCLDPVSGELWETENGPDRDDEVNRVEPGGNLGWPVELGRGTDPAFIQPELVFPDIIVPTGCAFSSSGRAMYFGDFAGGDLHRATVAESGSITGEGVIARARSGITDVARAPTGDIYVATSDSILRLASSSSQTPSPSSVTPTPSPSPGGTGTGSRAADGSSGVRTAIVAGLVVLLAAGLTARALAGRRLRRRTRGR